MNPTEAIDDILKHNVKLKKSADKLAEALEFYAGKRSNCGTICPEEMWWSEIGTDAGSVADKALKEYRGG
jgi:hypothetical protein